MEIANLSHGLICSFIPKFSGRNLGTNDKWTNDKWLLGMRRVGADE